MLAIFVPGRMGARVDIEVERVALSPIGRTRLIFGAIGHGDLHLVIIGMNIFFHVARPQRFANMVEPGRVGQALKSLRVAIANVETRHKVETGYRMHPCEVEIYTGKEAWIDFRTLPPNPVNHTGSDFTCTG